MAALLKTKPPLIDAKHGRYNATTKIDKDMANNAKSTCYGGNDTKIETLLELAA